jgi:tRNA(fMet)-specific endonuclease VapC
MILDTNALSALVSREDGLTAAISDAPRIAVTLISLGEYEYGLRLSRHRSTLENWLCAFLTHAEVLSPDRATLAFYADLRMDLRNKGTPIPANDCWIAALVLQHKMPVVSRDTHFDWHPRHQTRRLVSHPAKANPAIPCTPTFAAKRFPASTSGEGSASSRPFCAVVK